MSPLQKNLESLSEKLTGELHGDLLHRQMYATDASVYRNLPLAVVYPKNSSDLQHLVAYANENDISLTARTAGTSLAGQCVTDGIVIDFSRHFTEIEHIDLAARTVKVQPGVIRDELNRQLQKDGLFFGPNTSTSNRCMLGGMVGNNSSGTTSIRYGVTREKIDSLELVLYDGSLVTLQEETFESFHEKLKSDDPVGRIYRELYDLLSPKEIQQAITAVFPKPEIHRRNTGYALDALLETEPFGGYKPFNLAKLIAGSEGTLGLVTSMTLDLDPLPPAHKALIAAQYHSVSECLEDVAPLMEHKLYSCELMDKKILDCTANNAKYSTYRNFISGDPQAVLLLELCADSLTELEQQVNRAEVTLNDNGRAYYSPVLLGEEIDQAMELRKAGLGLLGNMIGDAKAVACIEDTAVAVEDLSEYIRDFTTLMTRFDQEVVYYAHAGAGELHLRPILNLKEAEDVKLFKAITQAVAALVKSYKGSLSGEHGDGIVRGSLLPQMLGEEVYGYLKRVKTIFDPNSIFNRGKIVDAWNIDERLRYEPGRQEPKVDTFLDFSESQGILRASEQCNGSGDCRKLPSSGGTLCPSYHATRNEKDTTRARANVLREILTNSKQQNPFNSEELKEVMDLCIGCKACSSECPSNVNVAKFKTEFQHQFRKANGEKRSDRFFAKGLKTNRFLAKIPWISNKLLLKGPLAGLVKRYIGIAKERSLPELRPYNTNFVEQSVEEVLLQMMQDFQVVLYIDEFTELYDRQVAEDAIELLTALGYHVTPFAQMNSCRALLSKGYLEEAKELIDENLQTLRTLLKKDAILVGLEPSAILGLRDEYTYMATDKQWAKEVAQKSFLIEEFIADQISKGKLTAEQFTDKSAKIKIHNHCYQKALSDQKCTFDMLNLPANYKPTIIPSGCCGMAGSFGYEKDHYEISMTIGNQTLFPAIEKTDSNTIIAANGTSCRHQILDGTARKALHPVSILKQALR